MVNWGILGAGNIAHRFAASLAQVEGAQLVAASCRTQEKADAFLAEVPCADDARGYAGHDALLADERIDIIYLALPHAFHHDWALAALRAGKAVLCEKPAMLTADEMREVAAVARETGTLFMEAMKPRFVPLYAQVRAAVGRLGTLTHVDATLCNDMLGFVEESGTYHMTPGPGAGVALDCGTYCASWIEDFLPGTPVRTTVAGQAKNGIDVYDDIHFACGDATARLECAFDRAKPRTATLVGTNGRLVVDELHRPQHATLFLEDGTVEELDAPYEVDDFFGEASHATTLVAAGITESPLMPLDASIRCAALIDAVRDAFVVRPAALDTLIEQERILRYPTQFGAAEALELGTAVARLAPAYDRGVTVQITRSSDDMVLFAWSMDDKAPRNYGYIKGKCEASRASGHASAWSYLDHELNAPDTELFGPDTIGFPTAGAFPIRVGDDVVATACVSGLHEGRDHELIVRALETALGTKAPALPCVVI